MNFSILHSDKSNFKTKQKPKPSLKQLLRKALYVIVSGLAFTSKPTVKYMFWLSANPATDPVTHVILNLAKQTIAATRETGHFTSILYIC